MGKNSVRVYSTNPDFQPEKDITDNSGQISGTSVVYLERDRKSRKGKTVTVISNYKGDLKKMLKDLQKLCGAGGSVKGQNVEIQGDHRDRIAIYFEQKNIKYKYKGG